MSVVTAFALRAEPPLCIQSDQNNGIPIVKKEDPLPDGTPRSPVVAPITCILDDVFGELDFTFLFPMGDVTITLTESMAGVVSSDLYSTNSCLVSVPIPCSGTFDISILLSSGVEYSGHFIY